MKTIEIGRDMKTCEVGVAVSWPIGGFKVEEEEKIVVGLFVAPMAGYPVKIFLSPPVVLPSFISHFALVR